MQVYVPWNVHEPFPEQYDWDGIADLEAYLQLAQDMGLYVLLRPGPYICAEWDFGGFPWWLASSKVWMCTKENVLLWGKGSSPDCCRGGLRRLCYAYSMTRAVKRSLCSAA